MKLTFVLFATATLLLQSGCVTGRRSFDLPVPTGDIPAATKGTVYIATVSDQRKFANKPSDPSTPSINGDVTTLSAAQKDRMIGRQRSGFGMAMGDIALPEGDSVTKRVRLLLEEGLKRRGCQISSEPVAPVSISVSVNEFWAWMTPGFFALTFEARLSCTVTVTKPDGSVTFVVKGYGKNHGQIAKDGNWQEAYDPAFEDFISNLTTELEKMELHPAGTSAGDSKPPGDLYAELKKLDELRKEGILTDQEFGTQKKKLLEKN